MLGVEGPKTKEPSKYIRFIYNRIILENATVRAAAVSSLAKFGAQVGDLRERVKVLLSRALHDNDDEVGGALHSEPETLQTLLQSPAGTCFMRAPMTCGGRKSPDLVSWVQRECPGHAVAESARELPPQP